MNNERITMKDLNEMVRNNFDGYTKEQVLNASVLAKSVKGTFADYQKKAEEKLESMMSVGDQLSLDFGSDTYTSTMVNTDDISFDCSDEDLYNIAQKEANLYCTHSVDKTAMKKDYKKGLLPTPLSDHIVITTQATMKITKKAKKGE